MSERDSAANEVHVVFTPSGRRGRFAIGTTVLDAARQLGVDLDSVCGGRGLCGRCQVVPAFGEFAKHAVHARDTHLGESTSMEARYQRINGAFVAGRRLGCQATLEGDMVIDIPTDSQVHRQVVRKAADAVTIRIDPSVRLCMVDVAEPDMHEPSGDLRRLRDALAHEWQIDPLNVDVATLQQLQATLRTGQWRVTAAIDADNRLLTLWPGYQERACGAAIDVGSTTIAAHLCDLASGEVLASSGCMNPQIRFGEDLMSRVSYVMMNDGGEQALTAAVREAIDTLLHTVCEEAGVTTDSLLDITLVGNPVMHHLLLGINPVELGGAPFALACDEAVSVTATDLGIGINTHANAYVLPCIAGHVGADTAAVILAERPDLREEISLLVDVGTNAEIVLGNRDRLLACSSPTGPAFEGAQISGGQRAAPGAIERVRIDPDTLEPRFRIIGSEHWSDEAAFDASIAGIGVTGICGSGIIEVVAGLFLAGIVDQEGVIRGELAARSPRIVPDERTFAYVLYGEQDAPASDAPITPIRITQNDIRQIQLAKAALYAGVRLLMDRLGVDTVDRIRLAGAFGSHIDVTYAMVLGLVPDCRLEAVSSAGNAAGTGARIALLDHTSRADIEALVRRVEKVETAVEPRFQEHFVDAMAFPHRTADFPQLARVITLPARTQAVGDAAAAQRARRARRRQRR